MSINSINRISTPSSGTEQIAGKTASGDHNNRVVNQSTQSNVDGSGSLSANIPLHRLQGRSVRRPTNSESRGRFNILRLCFGRQQQRTNRNISAPAKFANLEANTMNLVKGQTSALIEASQKGMAAARSNIVEGLAEEKSSAEVASFLKAGDKGIRRGTTAIRNLGRMISFANLSDAEKQKMPAESLGTLERQTGQTKEMATTISEAKFLDGTRDFFQCGTTAGNSYSEMMELHPEQDQAMRTWIRNGLNLGSELISAQEQILLHGREQSAGYISDLQSRVNVFAAIEKDPSAPMDSHTSVVEGFADEVISAQEEVLNKFSNS